MITIKPYYNIIEKLPYKCSLNDKRINSSGYFSYYYIIPDKAGKKYLITINSNLKYQSLLTEKSKIIPLEKFQNDIIKDLMITTDFIKRLEMISKLLDLINKEQAKVVIKDSIIENICWQLLSNKL